MTSREKKMVASLLSAVSHVERSLKTRDENGPQDWLFRNAVFVLESARKECEQSTGITSADR